MTRKWGIWTLALAGAMGVAGAAGAQQAGPEYPARPVRLLVGYAPGASTDIVARTIGAKLTERWGVQVVVDNRPGANTIIASDVVAKAPADGYTLLMGNSANATNPAVYAKLPYDGVKGLSSVVMVALATNLVSANPSFPAVSVRDLIALAKKRPGQVAYGSPGPGSSQHLIMELLGLRAGAKITPVHYRGGAPALVDTLSGQIPMMIGTIATQEQYVRLRKLKPLFVTSAQRSPALPDVPTLAEQGFPGLVSDYWLGIMGPAGLPRPIVARINQDVNTVLERPDVRDIFSRNGIAAAGGSAREMDRYFKDELAMWATVVRDAGIERLQM